MQFLIDKLFVIVLHLLIEIAMSTPSYVIEPITSKALDVGTRIHWDDRTGHVFFVDVPNGSAYKYEENGNKTTEVKVGNEPIAFMFPVEGSDTTFIAGLDRKIVLVEWDGHSPQVSSVKTVAEVDTDDRVKANRLNGGKIDPTGRLYAGTMGPDGEGKLGSLYSLTKGVLKKHECSIGISNGLAWNVAEKKMYYIDTTEPGVFQYDYDPDTGSIGNRSMIFNFNSNNIEGKPDGLTIDSEGNLWVCAIFGSKLIRFCPKTGKIMTTVDFPTAQVTSATFGGKNLDKIYVCTARIPDNGTVPAAPAGTTYVVKNLGVTGPKDTRYKIN